MSTRIATFAVDAGVSDEALLRALAAIAPEVLARSGAKALAVDRGRPSDGLPLRWFRLWTDGEPVPRRWLATALAPLFPRLVSAVHDDRSGQFLYERRSPEGALRLVATDATTHVFGALDPAARRTVAGWAPRSAIALGLALEFPGEPEGAPYTRVRGQRFAVAAGGAVLARAAPAASRDGVQPLIEPDVDDAEFDGDDEGPPIAWGDEASAASEPSLMDALDAADATFEAGAVDEALAAYRAAIARAPTDDLGWHVLARRSLEVGDRSGSLVAFRRAVALNPGNVFDLRDDPFDALADDPELAQILVEERAALSD